MNCLEILKKVQTLIWITFVTALLIEHMLIGYKLHNLIVANNVLEARYAEASSAEQSLATFVKDLVPMGLQDEVSKPKTSKTPTPTSPIGIPVTGKNPANAN